MRKYLFQALKETNAIGCNRCLVGRYRLLKFTTKDEYISRSIDTKTYNTTRIHGENGQFNMIPNYKGFSFFSS